MRIFKFVVLCALVTCAGTGAQDLPPFDVQMQLDPGSILVGQPIWVNVLITNRSDEALALDTGNSCFGAKEILISVPEAEQTKDAHPFCGVPGGSCWVASPSNVSPGETVRRRYVVVGNFRITHAGQYTVYLQQIYRYGPAVVTQPGQPQPFSELGSRQRIHAQLSLDVSPADPQKLLQIEDSLAENAAMIPPRSTPPAGADIDELRRWDEQRRQIEDDDMFHRASIADGIITYPAAGMEPIFRTWLEENNTTPADWAMRALANLNTPESRAILEQQAASHDKPNDLSYQIHRWVAIDDLIDMNDTHFLPVLETLVYDPYHDVQRTAVRALGILGREHELPLLNKLAHERRAEGDRADAIQAIGNSGTLKAVPLLIALYTSPNANEPGLPDYALLTLTHHDLPAIGRPRTPAEARAAWSEWWLQNKTTAHAYSLYDCIVPPPPATLSNDPTPPTY